MTGISRFLHLEQLARFLWAMTLIALPVTSFRYFPAGDAYVRPLAVYPLAFLSLLLLIQFLADRTRFPRVATLTPFVVFLLIALGASVVGLLWAPVPIRGEDALGRISRAWVTVLIGIAFFISAVWMNRNEEDLRFTLRWLFAGFLIDLLWSGLQAATFYLHVLPKSLVTHWQRAFSMRELIRTNRISGMAYEPSWLAGQISTIYFPWLFASLLSRVHVTRFKWLEPALLILALLLLLGTYSRGGLLTVTLSVVLTLLLVGRRQIRSSWVWFISGFRKGREIIWRLGVILLAAGALTGAFLFLGQKGYIARLWNTQATSVTDFIIQNSAGARAAYIWGALGAYQEHPWTGVGLGASGFYIYHNLPDWALTTVPEIARQLNPNNGLYPNPKNLYVRLLAETGLFGFFSFLAFQFSLMGDALIALRQKRALWHFLGIASVFTWLALILYNMTQDSFAIPNLWINLGVLVGISAFALQSEKSIEEAT